MSNGPLLRSRATTVLAVALVAALLGAVALSVVSLGPTEPNTELYLLNDDGTAGDYQTNLSVNETVDVVVGATNNEGNRQSYTLVARFSDRTVDRWSFTLSDGEEFTQSVEYTPRTTDETRVVFELYRGEAGGDPYRYVSLALNVTGS